MVRPKVFLFYNSVLSSDGSQLTVGGIQTYLLNLAHLTKDMGWNTVIVQEGTHDFEVETKGVKIVGRSVPNGYGKRSYRGLFSRVKDQIDPARDILIWGTFYMSVQLPEYTTIAIQHGISFDILRGSGIRVPFPKLYKLLQRRKALSKFGAADYKVCVDYNFPNWYRTFQTEEGSKNIFVIPNFADVPSEPLRDKTKFEKIVFARRFANQRGVHLMIEAVEELLKSQPNLSFTFAGEGEEMNAVAMVQSKFPENVEITRYSPEESITFHKNFDIAIVPSLGSEGTSLSLLEAMAAGCSVICTNVGGLTNIVIDRVNGLLIHPSKIDLVGAIEQIVEDPYLGNQLRKIARLSVDAGFSKSLWTEKWQTFLEKVSSERVL